MHVVINSHPAAQCKVLSHLSATLFSVPLYFKKDKSHKVFGISQTGDELDHGEWFCIDDIQDEWFQISRKVVNGSVINDHSIVIHVLVICF